MKKKIILSTLVSFILLVAVILAGINAVYTVASVRGNFHTYSSEGDAEAQDLQAQLDTFLNKSTVFLNLDKVRSVVEEYPYFRVDDIKKKYPDTIEISISERKETFAYLLANGHYATLDEEGVYLYEKDSNSNRIDNGENILLDGFGFSVGNETSGDYFSELIEIISEFRTVLSEIRANVISVTLVRGGTSLGFDSIVIQMREGVAINLFSPKEHAGELARLAIEKYAGVGRYEGNGLTDWEIVRGTITVLESSGDLKLDYRV